MSAACRPRPRARLSPTRPRPTRPASSGCAPPAQFPLGKTNLDQFATGLVGVRSPYGVPRNAFDPKLIPGGSSSGSGVAVAAGLVPFALGTDTAGSGRVPAGLGNTVGLKPSLGMVSTAGAVPACRTLDCISVFALTVDDAWAAFTAMAGPDIADPYTRNRPTGTLGPLPPLRIGVPIKGERVFFGDQVSAAQFEAAIDRFARLGATVTQTEARTHRGTEVSRSPTSPLSSTIDACLTRNGDTHHRTHRTGGQRH